MFVSTNTEGNLSNPAPLGLFSFASTTLMISLYNAGARDITVPNAVVGMAIFCGGLTQLLAGMWEFPHGDTFAATAFSSFGAFWMSFGTIMIPGSGIVSSYPSVTEFQNASGIYLTIWSMVTFFLLSASVVTLRKSLAFIILFTFVLITFALLLAFNLKHDTHLQKTAGIVGCITALVAYYIGLSELLASERQPFIALPLGVFPVKQSE